LAVPEPNPQGLGDIMTENILHQDLSILAIQNMGRQRKVPYDVKELYKNRDDCEVIAVIELAFLRFSALQQQIGVNQLELSNLQSSRNVNELRGKLRIGLLHL
jgi:hypothetical protein